MTKDYPFKFRQYVSRQCKKVGINEIELRRKPTSENAEKVRLVLLSAKNSFSTMGSEWIYAQLKMSESTFRARVR